MKRCALLLCMVSIAIACLPRPSSAQQTLNPGEILVIVTDAVTKAPIDNAEVFLLGGDSPISSLTNAQGELTFPDIAVGIYDLTVEHAKYDNADVAAIDVRENQRVTIAVALTASLRTIARVTARPAVSISSVDINANSADRKISASLLDALGKLAGVSVDDTTYGPNSAFSISLNNHDASQTGTSINGIQISGPSSGQLTASPAIFSGASVSFAPTAGYIGGTVNFQTLQPSKLWTYSISNTIGTYGAQTILQSATGSKGKFSLALEHVFTAGDPFLSGLTYADQSGDDYLHLASNDGSESLLKVSYAASQRISFAVQGIFENSNNGLICTTFTTLVPCGYGPGLSSTSHDDFVDATGNALVGNVAFTVYGAGSMGAGLSAYPGRSIGGTTVPYDSSSTSFGNFFGGSASITARRHTVTLSYSYNSFGGDGTITYDGRPVAVPQPRQYASRLNLYDRVKASEKLSLSHGLSLDSATGAGTSGTAFETADWQPSHNNTYEASIFVGSSQPNYYPIEPVGDPLTAQYDCYNGSVFVGGPADPAVHQSSTSYALSWLHLFRGGSITVALARQNAFGQPLSVSVPIDGEPSSIFPGGTSGYLGALDDVWSMPTVCGSIPFSSSRTYVIQSLTGLGQVNQRVDISGRVSLGHNVIALPTYAVASAYLSTLDTRLAFPNSFYAVGEQLPHRPLRTAGLTLDGVLPRARLEWLAHAQFTGGNNALNLPAFTTYTAGLVFASDHGTFTFLESNVFDNDSGLFTTYRGVNPMPVVGGGSFSYATSPAAPRQWQLTWKIPWMQHVSPPKKRSPTAPH